MHGSPVAPAVERDHSAATCGAVVQAARALAPAGSLRLVLQHVALRGEGDRPGRLRLLDAVMDVSGNLVPLRLWPERGPRTVEGSALEEAVAALDAMVFAHGELSGYTLRIDADGGSDLHLRTGEPLPAALLAPGCAGGEIHDGRHQIQHHADELEELRERLSAPRAGRLRRMLGSMTRRLDRIRR